MYNYVAMAKKEKGQSPIKCTFTAAGISDAMKELVKMMGVGSTTDLYEFEILEVMEKGAYKLSARKMPTKEKPHITVPVDRQLPAPKPKITYNENEYAGYDVRVA